MERIGDLVADLSIEHAERRDGHSHEVRGRFGAVELLP